VPLATLDKYGAVSRETAQAMALGALRFAYADIAVAITGIAGPGGGSRAKPVGLVHFAAASSIGKGQLVHAAMRYGDIGRAQVRKKSVLQALAMLKALLEK
jgi:nicotinamide-nucleotide amidase